MASRNKAPLYSREEISGLGFGPHEVWVIDNYFIKLKDGVQIAFKAWMPAPAKESFGSDLCEEWIYKYCDSDASANETTSRV